MYCLWTAAVTLGCAGLAACIGLGTVFMDAPATAKLNRVRAGWPRVLAKAGVAGAKGLGMACAFASGRLKQVELHVLESAVRLSADPCPAQDPAGVRNDRTLGGPTALPLRTRIRGPEEDD